MKKFPVFIGRYKITFASDSEINHFNPKDTQHVGHIKDN